MPEEIGSGTTGKQLLWAEEMHSFIFLQYNFYKFKAVRFERKKWSFPSLVKATVRLMKLLIKYGLFSF